MRPGTTKTATLTTGYQRLATLYGADTGDAIKTADGKEVANQCLLSIITQAGEIAFGETMPLSSGHPIAAGSSFEMGNQAYIQLAWVRGTSGAIAIITPLFE